MPSSVRISASSQSIYSTIVELNIIIVYCVLHLACLCSSVSWALLTLFFSFNKIKMEIHSHSDT